jgi:hypothetical protein
MIGRTVAHCLITAKLDGGVDEVPHATDTKLAARLLSRFCRRFCGGRWAHNQKQSTWPYKFPLLEKCYRPTWKRRSA